MRHGRGTGSHGLVASIAPTKVYPCAEAGPPAASTIIACEVTQGPKLGFRRDRRKCVAFQLMPHNATRYGVFKVCSVSVVSCSPDLPLFVDAS